MILKKSIGLLRDAYEYLVGERDSWQGASLQFEKHERPETSKK